MMAQSTGDSSLILRRIVTQMFSFDDIWSATSEKADGEVDTKIQVLADGFQRYMNKFYYEAQVWSKFLTAFKNWSNYRVLVRNKAATVQKLRVKSEEESTTQKNDTAEK